MKQFFTVLKFEFKNYAKSKIFLGFTLFFIISIAGLLTVPNILSKINSGEEPVPTDNPVIAVKDETGKTISYLTAGMTNYTFEAVEKSEAELKTAIEQSQYSGAIIVTDALKYKYIAKSISIYDNTKYSIDEIMVYQYRYEFLDGIDLPNEQVDAFFSAYAQGEVINLGKDQINSFFYTYILIFALYMAIMMYGQLVASGVASEKSSRAMELLITSAKPTSLIFGKVIGAGLSGFVQIFSILLSAFIFYNLNDSYWAGNEIIASIFDMPLQIMFFTVLFFILGFFIYAFLYGALGSFANKAEDVSLLITPITLLFVTVFMVVMFSMSSGNVDSTLMKICSYIPFSSPMAMFTRIAMGEVPTIGIIISIIILIASTIAIGYFSAAVYKLGVLMYGKPPKFSELFKMIRNSKKNYSKKQA